MSAISGFSAIQDIGQSPQLLNAGFAPSLSGGLSSPFLAAPSLTFPLGDNPVLLGTARPLTDIQVWPTPTLAAHALPAASVAETQRGAIDAAHAPVDAKTHLTMVGEKLAGVSEAAEKTGMLDGFFTGARQIYGQMTGSSSSSNGVDATSNGFPKGRLARALKAPPTAQSHADFTYEDNVAVTPVHAPIEAHAERRAQFHRNAVSLSMAVMGVAVVLYLHSSGLRQEGISNWFTQSFSNFGLGLPFLAAMHNRIEQSVPETLWTSRSRWVRNLAFYSTVGMFLGANAFFELATPIFPRVVTDLPDFLSGVAAATVYLIGYPMIRRLVVGRKASR